MRIKRDVRTGHIRLIWFGTAAAIGVVQAGWRGAVVGILVALLVLLLVLAFALWGHRQETRGRWPFNG